MTFNSQWTSGMYTKARSGQYAGLYMISFMENEVLFAGQIAEDLSAQRSWARFAYNNVTVGAYTDVEYNVTVLIGTVNDITQATWRGRVRDGEADATYVYCTESSADFGVGDYFWVINTFDLTNKLSRPDSSGVQLIDYDVAYHGQKPVMLGLRTAYAGWASSATGKLRIAFDISQSYHPAAISIVSYQFIFKAGTYTVISGSPASAIVTVDLDPGEQWVKVIITDSAGVSLTRRAAIKVHDADYPPDSGFQGIKIDADFSKPWSLDTTALTGVDGVLNRTFFIVWRADEQYGRVTTSLDDNNIAFCGWLERESDSEQPSLPHGVKSNAAFECVSVGTALQRLEAQGLAFKQVSVPTLWNEVTNLTWWAAIVQFFQEYYTAGDLCDIDVNDRSQRFKFPLLTTEGENALPAAQKLADSADAYIEFAPDGRIGLNVSAEYMDEADRADVITVANWTAADIKGPDGVTRTVNPNPTVGKVDADGAYYNNISGQVEAFTSRAPGIAQGEAGGSSTLSGQVLAATTDPVAALNELLRRSGTKYLVDNNNERLKIKHPGGYVGLIPSRAQYFTWTLEDTDAAPDGVHRIIYDTSVLWLLESVSYTPGKNGTCAVEATYLRLVPVGDPGDNTTKIAPNEIPPALPDLGLPAFNVEFPESMFPDTGLLLSQVSPAALLPPKGQILATTGQTLVVKSAVNSYLLKNFITLKKPQSRQVTPSDLGDYAIKVVLIDRLRATKTAVPVYLLASDATHSAVWYTPNVGALPPVWTKGDDVDGIYTHIKLAKTAGTILIESAYSDGPGPWTKVLNFELSNYGAQTITISGQTTPTPIDWSLGTGFQTYDYETDDGDWLRIILASIPLPASAYITSATLTYDAVAASVPINTPHGVEISASVHASINSLSIVTGNNQTLAATTPDGTASEIFLEFWVDAKTDQGDLTGSGVIKSVELQGDDQNPYGGGNTRVRKSTDSGGTFGAEITGGPSGSVVSGFDVQIAGTVSFVGAQDGIYKATTLGGSYSLYYDFTGANVVAVETPWYRWRSATQKQTTVSDPDVYVALDAFVGGTLFAIDGATGIAYNIDPVVGIVFDSPHCIMSYYGTHIMVYGKVGGVYKLYESHDGGIRWTFLQNLTSPAFLTNRSGDTRANTTAGRAGRAGQVYLAENGSIDYSSKWASNWTSGDHFPRTLPASGIDGMDVLG